MQHIRELISTQAMQPGERLPSIRGMAESLQVSATTVVEAFDRLAAEGLVHPKRGSGYFVSNAPVPTLPLTNRDSIRDRELDPLWVSCQSFDADPSNIIPGCGWLPSGWMPIEAINREMRSMVKRESSLLTEYGTTRGSPALRKVLMARLAEEEIAISPDQLLLTNSGTQAIDLLCRFLTQPGDVVLVDDPCYFNFCALLAALKLKVVSVPYGKTGPELDEFEKVLREHKPKIYLTNSAIHNPTGVTMTVHVAHRILTLAAEHNLLIIEDDIFADYEPDRSLTLASLDQLDRVIRVGSFSKTISASMRCGYIATRSDWSEEMRRFQVAINLGGPCPIAAEVIHRILTGGGYRKHMEEVRRRLISSRKLTIDRLRKLGIEVWHLPRGGFFLWCRLPSGIDSAALAKAAYEQNIVLAPGNVFSVQRSWDRYMRFNVAHCVSPSLFQSLAHCMQSL